MKKKGMEKLSGFAWRGTSFAGKKEMQAGRTCLGSCDARRGPEITPFARKRLGAELVSHREEKGRWVFAWELAGNGQNCRATRLKQQVERGVVKNGCDWPWCAGMQGRRLGAHAKASDFFGQKKQ